MALTRVSSGLVATNTNSLTALEIDCSLGTYFSKTVTANSSLTVNNIPTGRAYAFTLELTVTGGSVYWFSGVQWPGALAPTLTVNKTHLLTFLTDDGGTTWFGSFVTDYAS